VQDERQLAIPLARGSSHEAVPAGTAQDQPLRQAHARTGPGPGEPSHPHTLPAAVSAPWKAPRRVVLARRTAQVPALAVAVVGLAALLYFVSLHSEAPSSDGATIVLEAKAMANGNLALKGWALSLDSFWSIDTPLYLLAVVAAGLRPLLLELMPAAIATITVLAGAFAARLGLRGPPAVVASATTIGLVALPSHTLAVFLLKGGQHVTTTLWCLLAFLALRRGRFGWGWMAAVALLAAGLLGDLLALALGVVPVCGAGLAAMARQRHWRAGTATLGAGLASTGLAAGVRAIASTVGTFSIVHVQSGVSPGQMVANAAMAPVYLAHLLGAGGGFYGNGGVPDALQALHSAGLVVAATAVVAAIGVVGRSMAAGGAPPGRPARRWLAGPPQEDLDVMLLLGCIGSLVAYVALARSLNPAYSRYITPAVVFGAVLAGRWLGWAASSAHPGPRRRAALAVGVALLATFGAGVGLQLAQPVPPQSTARLANFLAQHHLRAGLGDYWCSSVVTVQSQGHVVVRPVIANAEGHLVRYARQSSAGWYRAHAFAFLVFNATQPFGAVSQRTAVNTFGKPSRALSFGPYRVLVWPHPISVSPLGAAT
jgi:hypothetical protein